VSSSGRLVIGDFATVMCGALRSRDGTSLFDAFGQQNYKPEWPQVNSEKCIDERPITKDLSIGQADSHRLRRPHKSVHDIRGVQVDTNDDTARIYPSRITEDGSGRVERREHAIAQQKRVSDA